MTLIVSTIAIMISLISLLFSTGYIKANSKKDQEELKNKLDEVDKYIKESKIKKDKYEDYRNENGLLSNKNKAFKINNKGV